MYGALPVIFLSLDKFTIYINIEWQSNKEYFQVIQLHNKFTCNNGYVERVSNKRLTSATKADADVHARTRAPIQAALVSASWAAVSTIVTYAAASPLLITLALQKHVS
jgi:hypothetical protein